jgi:hypothetical protein
MDGFDINDNGGWAAIKKKEEGPGVSPARGAVQDYWHYRET